MKRLHFHVRAGSGTSVSARLLAILVGSALLACILLLLAGLWVLLVVAAGFALLAGLLFALFPRWRPKPGPHPDESSVTVEIRRLPRDRSDVSRGKEDPVEAPPPRQRTP